MWDLGILQARNATFSSAWQKQMSLTRFLFLKWCHKNLDLEQSSDKAAPSSFAFLVSPYQGYFNACCNPRVGTHMPTSCFWVVNKYFLDIFSSVNSWCVITWICCPLSRVNHKTLTFVVLAMIIKDDLFSTILYLLTLGFNINQEGSIYKII